MVVLMKVKKLYYKIFFLFLFLTFILGDIYRNYIYTNNINDYGLADIYPNIRAVIIASFLFMAKAKYIEDKEEVTIILSVVLGFILYEFVQIKIPISTFDWKDIIGTIIGGIITFVIYKLLTIRLNVENKKSKAYKDV